MKKFLLLSTILFAPTLAFAAANGPSSSPRVQGVPDGYGDPVQVTIVAADGSDATLSVTVTDSATSAKQDTQITAEQAILAKIIAAPATEAKQDNAITQETAINTVLGTVTASPTANTIGDRLKTINTTLGTPLQAGGTVVVTGAATAAKQPALGTATILSADVISVARIPTVDSTAGIAPTVTSAVASNLVVCAAACNMYGFNVTTGASAGYVMLINATSAPGDGAVTPSWCLTVGANTGIDVNWRDVPRRMSTGATLVFSTTGCFTKTASATAFISGEAK